MLLIFKFFFLYICRNLMVNKIIIGNDVMGCIFFLCVCFWGGDVRVLFFDYFRINLLIELWNNI